MRNKTAFKKAQAALDNRDQPKTVHYLKMVYLKDVQKQTFFWIKINKYFNHQEVFEHFQRTKNATSLPAAMGLVEYLGSQFWWDSVYDNYMYYYDNRKRSYMPVDWAELQAIIDKYKNYK